MGGDVLAWMKRLNRKGPFYIYNIQPKQVQDWVDNKWIKYEHPSHKSYTVIWNDGDKTKIGILEDGMYCRYGISTKAYLAGDRPQDMWQGRNVSDDEYAAMVDVRKDQSSLKTLDLNDLKDLAH